jgi:hypothetical protein
MGEKIWSGTFYGPARRIVMKKYLAGLALSMILPVTQSHAAHVNFNVGVNVGVPVAPVYAAPPVAITAPPDFIAPPELGFYVAVGVPYDMFFYGDRYWLCRGNVWYSAPYYNGPWVSVGFGNVPYLIRKYPLNRVHYFRDNYYRRYHAYGNREYRHFRPDMHEMGRDGRGWGHEGHHEGRGEGHGRHGR